MAKYLVTGGCGFIGSHLVDYLCEVGHTVRLLDNLSTGKEENRERGEFVKGSITDPIAWRKALEGVDGVFHLAAIPSVAQSVEKWHATHVVNSSGAVHLFDLARGLPIVYASSAAVYGDPTTTPVSEETPLNPLSPYAADKISCEMFAKVAWHLFQTPSVGCRFFNVYGSRQDPSSPYSGVISIFQKQIAAGEEITIYGDGKQTRDFIYVGDVVEMLAAAMSQLKEGASVYNFCTGIGTTIEALATLMGEELGKEVKLKWAPAREGEIHLSIGDPSQLCTVLGIEAKTSLSEGLKRTRIEACV